MEARHENRQFNYLTKRIGSTVYKVKVQFSDTVQETLQDKILRMIRNEASTNDAECGIIQSPQMSRPA